MVDILERLQSQRTSLGTLWPEPNLHEEAAEKIIQLREELAAVTERMSKLDFERTAAELERDALREENARLREELQKDFNAMRVFRRYRELEAEIETLRGLLREAHVKMDANNLWSNLRNRVAAAIREGGKDA